MQADSADSRSECERLGRSVEYLYTKGMRAFTDENGPMLICPLLRGRFNITETGLAMTGSESCPTTQTASAGPCLRTGSGRKTTSHPEPVRGSCIVTGC